MARYWLAVYAAQGIVPFCVIPQEVISAGFLCPWDGRDVPGRKRRDKYVTYRNGKELLPPELLRQIQEYIQGEIVYIPRCEEHRAGWGEMNGTRVSLLLRNMEIRKLYREGIGIWELAEQYHLSEHSIRKVVSTKSGKEKELVLAYGKGKVME